MHQGRFFLAIFSLVLLASCDSGEFNPDVAADDPAIRYTGRWNFDDPQAPWVGWQGSTVSIAFRGSGISTTVDFGDEGETLRVIVDGVPEEPARSVPAGKRTLVLAAELDPDEEHIVTLMKEEYARSKLIDSENFLSFRGHIIHKWCQQSRRLVLCLQ